MANKVIAVIKLAPGEVAFYDPTTNTHLTIGHPEKTLFSGQNLSVIKRSVKSGRLNLVSGSLTPVVKSAEKVIEIDQAVNEEKTKTEIIDIKIKQEEIENSLQEKKEKCLDETEIEEEVMIQANEESKPKRGRKKKLEAEDELK